MKKQLTQVLILLGSSVIVTLLFFYNLLGKRLFKLNTLQWDMSGDGFKNYFNFAYQYNHGKGLHYEGTLYPYGDVLVYSDAQPAILLFFKTLKSIGINLEGYELFIIQGLPILSVLIAINLFTLLFKEYKIPWGYGFIYAVLIVMLSPQLYRIQSHYSLSYVAMFPASWFLYMKIKANSYIKMSVFVLWLVFLGFVHPYNLLIMVVFFLSLGLVDFIKSSAFQIKSICPAVAIAIYMVLMKLIDPYTDRPANPLGLTSYKTEISDLFPFYGWFNEIFGELLMLRTNYFEGYSYIGLLIFILPFYPILIKKIKNKQMPSPHNYLIAGFLCLAFAMGLHLIVGKQIIYDLIPQLGQFRSLGRFSWPFYYTALFGILFTLHHLLNRKYLQIAMAAISIVYLIDILAYHKTIKKNISTYQSNNLLYDQFGLYENLVKNPTFNIQDYQAIMVLPPGSEGVEKLTLKTDWHAKLYSMRLAMRLGLPTMNVLSSRSSISNSLNIIQTSSSPYASKAILEDFPNKKDLLAIVNNEDTLLFYHLIDQKKPLASNQECSVYRIDYDEIGKHQRFTKAEIKDHFKIPSSYYYEPDSMIFYNGFEENETLAGLYSDHSAEILNEFVLFEDQIKIQGKLQFSIWYRIEVEETDIPFFTIRCYDEAGKEINYTSYRDFLKKKVEIEKDWILLSYTLELPDNTDKLNWTVTGNHIDLDHALISSPDFDIIKTLNSNKYLVNGSIVELED